MEFKTTRVFDDNLLAYQSGMRRALNQGGTASSKTWTILQLLIFIAQHSRTPLIISVVSESLPHLKRGCIRDFFRVLGESTEANPKYNKTEQQYHLGLSMIEFFGADESDKVRGPRRDILFINEANNVAWETARGLDVRTARFTFCDWNPVSEFWVHENWVGQPKNAFIESTYLDAKEVLLEQVVKDIESYRTTDPNWFAIYGLGHLGKIEGLVYPFFEQVDELPPTGVTSQEFYGLDFGFSVDPTALVKCCLIEQNLYCKQIFYEKRLTNDGIAALMLKNGVRQNYDEIWADSSEPKSIEEIHRLGFNIKPVPKGADSVAFGHQRVRQFKQFWTKDSLECIREQRNFRYIEDKDGKLTDKTVHTFSHGMDARRYAVMGGTRTNSFVSWKEAFKIMQKKGDELRNEFVGSRA